MSPESYKRCRGCGYILDGLPLPRCPECGRAFDPHALATKPSPPPDGRRHLALAAGGLTLILAAVIGEATLGLMLPGHPLRWTLGLVTFAGGLILTGATIGAAWRFLRKPPALVRHRRAAVAAVVVAGLPYGAVIGWTAVGVAATLIELLLK